LHLCQAEIEHLYGAVLGNLHIRRLEIPVHDPLLVRDFKGLCDLPRDRESFVEWQRTARDPLRQILAGHQLHHESVDSLGVFEPVNLRNVGVVQRRQGPRLALETRNAVGIRSKRLRENFDRDIAVEPSVPRPVDLAHAAGADRRQDFVNAETCAGWQEQVS
jgi:hypothetical protein